MSARAPRGLELVEAAVADAHFVGRVAVFEPRTFRRAVRADERPAVATVILAARQFRCRERLVAQDAVRGVVARLPLVFRQGHRGFVVVVDVQLARRPVLLGGLEARLRALVELVLVLVHQIELVVIVGFLLLLLAAVSRRKRRSRRRRLLLAPRPATQERHGGVDVARSESDVDGAVLAIGALGIRLGAGVEQSVRCLDVAELGGDDQRRVAVGVAGFQLEAQARQ
mmetsp:Transcript_23339/g.71795  ORF Transcript_23339/g.71795 Transcript_23339/m.71795 type:complete len:227 (+) Transcript_23339:401-1081(+)